MPVRAAQTPPQEAEEKQIAPQEELPQDEEQPEAKEDVPEEGQPEAAEEEELPEPERETAEEENTEALPPLDESLALVQNEPEQPDETEGMSLIERARYHARMRRREQTRLRRENARRGGAEPYQPMSMMDVRFTSVRLAVAVVFLLLGLLSVLRSKPAVPRTKRIGMVSKQVGPSITMVQRISAPLVLPMSATKP